MFNIQTQPSNELPIIVAVKWQINVSVLFYQTNAQGLCAIAY